MAHNLFEKELIDSLSLQLNSTTLSCLSDGVKALLCDVGVAEFPDFSVSAQDNDNPLHLQFKFKPLVRVAKDTPASPAIEGECSVYDCDSEDHKQATINLNLIVADSDNQCIEIHTSFCPCSNDFIHFNKEFTSFPVADKSKIDLSACYKTCIQNMAPAFKWSEVILENLNIDAFCKKYTTFLDWTKSVTLFCDCFELLSHKDGVDDLTALLVLCSGLEKALGNVFLTKGKKCPGMLKDLLATAELRNILGDSVISVLRVLMGPPVSMNLRNVAWHGFLSVDELPRRYVYFILLLAVSIGKLLSQKNISPDAIENREYFSLTGCDVIALHLPGGATVLTEEFQHLVKLIVCSWVVTNGNRNIVKSGLSHYKNQNYGWCALCLLPLLESTLRRLFVAANRCPERLMTAEATTLYTTFEEMLDLHLPDGSENKLLAVCGEPFMDLLHDLLIYPKGPRARDKLSHGEADYRTVPQTLCRVLVYCLAHLSLKFGPHETLCPVNGYTSSFHPVSLLKHQILELSALGCQVYLEQSSLLDHHFSKTFESIQKSFIGFVQCDSLSAVDLPDWKPFLQMSMEPYEAVHENIHSIFSKVKLRTLHRWHPKKLTLKATCARQISESEIVNLMSRVVRETEVCLRQTDSVLQLRQKQQQEKQLRSRQRENLQSLLDFLPSLSLMINYILILSSWIYCQLNDYGRLGDVSKKTLHRHLKNCLQTCENLRSYTSAESCKWSLAREIILKEMNSAKVMAGQNVFHPDKTSNPFQVLRSKSSKFVAFRFYNQMLQWSMWWEFVGNV